MVRKPYLIGRVSECNDIHLDHGLTLRGDTLEVARRRELERQLAFLELKVSLVLRDLLDKLAQFALVELELEVINMVWVCTRSSKPESSDKMMLVTSSRTFRRSSTDKRVRAWSGTAHRRPCHPSCLPWP